MGEEAYIIASNTEPGIVLMSVNEYRSLEELRSEAVAGLQDANGTSLMLSGELIELTANALVENSRVQLNGNKRRLLLRALSTQLDRG